MLLAFAILTFGLLPIFNLFRSTRGVLGQSREMLALESKALEALGRARQTIAAGELHRQADEEERSLDLSDLQTRCVVTVVRQSARRLFVLTVRAETGDRYFVLTRMMADPLSSYLSPADRLPEPIVGEGGR